MPDAEQGQISEQGFAKQSNFSQFDPANPLNIEHAAGQEHRASEPVAPLTAKQRLRAFEDEVLGEKAVRISGHIERGSGSHFQTKMTDEQRAHHAALERLVEAEQKLADASAALAGAEAARRAAEEHVARGEGIADGDDQPE